MALKVVPAGDERCDIHNQRESRTYICETCLKELGIGSEVTVTSHRTRRRTRARRALRRWRSRVDWKVLIGAAVAVILVVVLVVGSSGGGGGSSGSGSSAPTEADVVNALNLVPDVNSGGWITVDGACAVVAIQFGKDVQHRVFEATNENGTVGALVLQNNFSTSQADCVNRIATELKAHF
jgi:hypothetical protein